MKLAYFRNTLTVGGIFLLHQLYMAFFGGGIKAENWAYGLLVLATLLFDASQLRKKNQESSGSI